MPELVQMDVGSLIGSVRAAGIELRVEGSRLRFKAPDGAFTDAMRAGLRAHRDDVIRYLRNEAAQSLTTGPLAANQAGMWFLQRLVPSNTAYNIAFVARIHGALDIAVLDESLQTLVDRHESLRTAYPLTDGEPSRLVTGYTPVSITVVPAEGWSAAQLDDVLSEDYAEPFDLELGPVLRARVYREAPDRHVLLLVAHHIAVDGTSLFVLLEELFEAYEILATGKPAPERDPSAEFAQFVSWQSTQPDADDSARYWQGVLTPPPPPLDLPLDRPRARIRAMAGGTHWHELPADLSAALRAQARAAGVTDYVLLMALWFAFLNRLSAQNDITVGTPVQGRPSARFARTIGDFVNTLPIRLTGISDAAFSDIVSRTKSVVLQGMTHQDYPLPRMMEHHASSTGAGAAPFQTLFILQDFTRFERIEKLMLGAADDRVSFGSLELSPIRMDQQEGQFDLSLDVWPRPDTLLLAWRYDTDLLGLETVQRWVRTFESVARAVIASPDVPIAGLDVLSPQDRAQLDSWNATDREYPQHATLHDLIEEQSARTPAATAITAADGDYTYAELILRARKIAAELRSMGVNPGDRVAVLVPRGRDMVASLLGVLGAGASYVPLDPAYPAARISYMLDDSRSAAIITTGALPADIDAGAPVLDLSRVQGSATEPFTRVGADSIAYVIYTSGSTGQPKGVAIPHRALVNFLTSMAAEPGFTAADSLLAVTTISFDIAGLELYLPLTVGGRVVIATEDEVVDGRRLAERLRTERINVLQATPATWKLLLESGWSGEPDLRAFCGGEALPESLAEALCPRVSELWNLYGPTETTIWSTVQRVQSGDPVLVGRPIANTTVYVRNAAGQRTPIGVPGELWIGGAGLASGYVDRPELTAERFVASPYRDGERLYRTGDLVRFTHDGLLQHLGRLDHQVKVRGYRIELGEIEARLRAHADVSDAVVIARDDRLLAFFVPQAAAPDTGTLRTWMSTTLPDYMVPAVFVPLEALPLTPNGKVDRNALPVHPLTGDIDRTTRSVPTSPTEIALADIWTAILDVDDPRLEDSFFELGGHSLLAARMVASIHDRLDVDVPIRIVFEAFRLEDLAGRIDDLLAAGASAAARTDEVLESFEF